MFEISKSTPAVAIDGLTGKSISLDLSADAAGRVLPITNAALWSGIQVTNGDASIVEGSFQDGKLTLVPHKVGTADVILYAQDSTNVAGALVVISVTVTDSSTVTPVTELVDSSTGIAASGVDFATVGGAGETVQMRTTDLGSSTDAAGQARFALLSGQYAGPGSGANLVKVYSVVLDLVNTVTGAVDGQLTDGFGELTLSLPVDPALNGASVHVVELHGTNDEAIDLGDIVVDDGCVVVKVTKLSDFVITKQAESDSGDSGSGSGTDGTTDGTNSGTDSGSGSDSGSNAADGSNNGGASDANGSNTNGSDSSGANGDGSGNGSGDSNSSDSGNGSSDGSSGDGSGSGASDDGATGKNSTDKGAAGTDAGKGSGNDDNADKNDSKSGKGAKDGQGSKADQGSKDGKSSLKSKTPDAKSTSNSQSGGTSSSKTPATGDQLITVVAVLAAIAVVVLIVVVAVGIRRRRKRPLP